MAALLVSGAGFAFATLFLFNAKPVCLEEQCPQVTESAAGSTEEAPASNTPAPENIGGETDQENASTASMGTVEDAASASPTVAEPNSPPALFVTGGWILAGLALVLGALVAAGLRQTDRLQFRFTVNGPLKSPPEAGGGKKPGEDSGDKDETKEGGEGKDQTGENASADKPEKPTGDTSESIVQRRPAETATGAAAVALLVATRLGLPTEVAIGSIGLLGFIPAAVSYLVDHDMFPGVNPKMQPADEGA
ncbi:MAG: hypothetical protein WD276_07340 [Actinomycetota bacterium]